MTLEGDYFNHPVCLPCSMSIINNVVNSVAITSDGAMNNTVAVACITGDSEILLADGSTIPIQDIDPGMVVKTLEGEQEVLNLFNQGDKEVVELTFDTGETLTCTPDHRIRTSIGWIEAGNLTEEHEVIGYDKD